MKRLRLIPINILFAVLCLVFTTCNQGMTAGKETGTVRVVIGNGAVRSVDAEGLPVFDDTNTKITVTGEDGNTLGEGTTSLTLQVPVGKKITVEVVVTTAAGVWRGLAVHTVQAGDNPVTVKLSKTPKSMKNILLRVVKDDPTDPEIALQLGDKELLTNVKIGSNNIRPVIARDGNGRVYVLYEKGGSRHFTRFDAEGNEDAGFETAIKNILPGSGIGRIKTMTVDPKTGTLFVAVVTTQPDIYAVTETGHNTFTRSDSVDLTTLPDIETNDEITAVAAYNGELFLTVQRNRSPSLAKPNKLFACTAALSGTTLTLTEKNAAELDELRTSAVMNVPTQCTGLFADASGVYCLLREQRLDGGMLYYMVGALACYSRDDNTVTYLKKHPKAGTNDEYLPFDSDAFADPIGFIGSDEENIYIADDGINIKYLNENWRIDGNKNRIAAFNRKTNEITFTDTEATWYGQKPEYKFPETPVLLWERDFSAAPAYNGVRYWVSTDGTSPAPADSTKIYQTAVSPNEIMDVFCYDQEGNLYILWKEGPNYCIQRFEFKDNSYDFTQGVKLNLGITVAPTSKVVAIAADVSDGTNFLYCAAKRSAGYTINQWTWDSNFTSAAFTSYSVTLPSGKDVTALAANKDGVFVATEKEELDSGSLKYHLKVQKYKKSDGSPDGELTLVGGGIRYKDVSNNPLPVAPSSGDYKETVEEINGLQVVESVLYAATVKIEKEINRTYGGGDRTDVLKSSGKLYKVKETDAFSGSATELAGKDWNDVSETGYGFYRFIAVIPKKLVIASDGAWSTGGKAGQPPYSPPPSFPVIQKDTNKVLKYDLDGHLQNGEDGETAGGSFSKELVLDGCGFSWK